MKHLRSLDDEHTKSLQPPSVPIVFQQIQKYFPSVLPKKAYQVSLRLQSKSDQGKSTEDEMTSRAKISEQDLIVLFKLNTLAAEKQFSGIRKKLRAHKGFTPNVINQLS